MARIRSLNIEAIPEIGVFDQRHLYIVGEVGSERPVKIGRASNAKWRLSCLRGGNPRELELRFVWIVDRADAVAIERRVHEHFRVVRGIGEWFFVTADEVARYVEVMV